MQAAVINKYGDPSVFEIKELEQPQCNDNQILVKVAAAGINPIDWKIRKGMLRFILPLKFPAVLGFDVCGEVVKCGQKANLFKPGDWIFARSTNFPGKGYAQFVALDENYVMIKPANLTPIEAASVPLAALTALQALRDCGRIKSGSDVMIIGASGGVGLFAVQLANVLGARVTAVCSTANVSLVKSLGANKVIDYKQAPLFDNENKYDLIFDAVAKQTYTKAKNHLKTEGVYVSTLPSGATIRSLITNWFTAQKCYFVLMKNRASDLSYIAKLLTEQKIKPIIDSVYPLEQVAAAHMRSESEHAHGKIVLEIA